MKSIWSNNQISTVRLCFLQFLNSFQFCQIWKCLYRSGPAVLNVFTLPCTSTPNGPNDHAIFRNCKCLLLMPKWIHATKFSKHLITLPWRILPEVKIGASDFIAILDQEKFIIFSLKEKEDNSITVPVEATNHREMGMRMTWWTYTKMQKTSMITEWKEFDKNINICKYYTEELWEPPVPSIEKLSAVPLKNWWHYRPGLLNHFEYHPDRWSECSGIYTFLPGCSAEEQAEVRRMLFKSIVY